MLVFQGFPTEGVVALYDEPNSIGDPTDINAPRNLPALDPENNLDLVHFHPDLDYLEVAQSAVVPFLHAEVAAGAPIAGNVNGSVAFSWAGVTSDSLLLNISALGLSSPPFVLVAANGNILWPGMPVQTASGGRARYCSIYATTAAVRIWETASRSNAALPATTIDYTVLVFREPPAAIGNYLMNFDPSTGVFEMGFGKFRTDRRYLQIAVSSPLGLSYGRTIDLKNGAPRAIRPDGTAYDPVPATMTATVTPGTGVAGPSMAYDGTFAGTGAIQVEAP